MRPEIKEPSTGIPIDLEGLSNEEALFVAFAVSCAPHAEASDGWYGVGADGYDPYSTARCLVGWTAREQLGMLAGDLYRDILTDPNPGVEAVARAFAVDSAVVDTIFHGVFGDLADSLVVAAKELGMDKEKAKALAWAFAEVEIEEGAGE